MKQLLHTTVFLSLTASFLLAGCAKDMNAEDYKERQRARDKAKLMPAIGTYTGVLKSMRSGANIGALKMQLSVETKPQGDSPDSGRASGKPVLQVLVTLEGALDATVSASDSYFDSASGQLTASIAVKRVAPVAGQLPPADATISIVGFIGTDGTFKGSMEASEGTASYKDDGATFELRRGGPSLEEIKKASTPDPKVFFTRANHAGRAKFLGFGARDDEGKQITKPVNLVLLKPSRSNPDQDFVELLLPTKPVIATLNFSDTAKFAFGNAVLDRRTGTLKGDANVSATTSTSAGTVKYEGTLTLSCDPMQGAEGLNCRVRSNGSTDDVLTMQVVARHGGSTEPSEPQASPPKQYFYYGKGVFPKGINGREKIVQKITLMATTEGKTLDEEIWDLLLPSSADRYLQVSFGFTDMPGTGGNPNWSGARFTNALRKLIAKGSGVVPGSWMTLDCDDFTFLSPRLPYKFKCVYVNSVNNVPCPLEFTKSR